MKVGGQSMRTIWLEPDGWSVRVIDQTALPHRLLTARLTTLADNDRVSLPADGFGVEAGKPLFDFENRFKYRERMIRYGENPWGKDHLDGYEIEGPLQSRSMQVGGLAMHWGGVTPRFSTADSSMHAPK